MIKNFMHNLMDAIDSPGGHICVCVSLLFAYGWKNEAQGLSHDIVLFALGVLSRSMGTATPLRPQSTTVIQQPQTTTAP